MQVIVCRVVLLCAILLSPTTYGQNFTFNCDLDIEAPTKRYFSPDRECIQFRVSDRLLHQLTTRVTSIFFKNVLGYQDICLTPYEDTNLDSSVDATANFLQSFSRILSNLMTSPSEKVPLIADVDVLVPSGCYLHYDHIEQLETLGPSGRYSFYVPKKSIEQNKVLRRMSNHMDSFSRREYLAEFVTAEQFIISGKNSSSDCEKCPVVLAKAQSEVKFVEQVMEKLNLTMKVIYAEDEFELALNALLEGTKPFLVFHWSQELPNFTLIQPPPCEELMFPSKQCSREGVCLLEPMTSLKITSANLEKVPLAYQALMKIRFNRTDYDELRAEHRKLIDTEEAFNEAACKWMKTHTDTWQEWKRTLDAGKVEIKLVVYVPENSSESYTIMRAFERAVAEGNSDLDRVELTLIRESDMCDVPGYASLLTQKLTRIRPDGFIGPSCNKNLLAVAENVQYYNTPLLSYLAKGTELKNKRKQFSNFFQVIGNMDNYVNATHKFMKQMGWNEMAVIGIRDSPYASYLASLNTSELKVQEHLIQNFTDIWSKLNTIKMSFVKIIYVDVDLWTYNQIMCRARELQMTYENNYIWVTPLWFEELLQSSNRCTESMLEGTFFLQQASFANTSRMLNADLSIEEWRTKLRTDHHKYHSAPSRDNHVGFAYDSVLVFVKVLKQIEENEPWLLAELSESRRRQRVAQLIGAVDFDGMSGHVKFDADGNRKVMITVNQWNKETGLRTVGQFGEDIDFLRTGQMRWANGRRPECVSRCYFVWRINCEQRPYYYAVFVILMLMVAAFVALVVWYKRKVKRLREQEHIGFTVDRSIQITPKDLVKDVKLGSGQFGDVWGANLKIVDTSGKTIFKRVAAKYLKTEAFYELRDFLYEAECLKQFNHKNIIKLEGVCLEQNVICIVLEFMLHGDLRSYLINRKQLLFQQSPQKSDLGLYPTPRRLTSFAADIACALVYLEEKKKLHRDIASRNVLIHASGVAKLADFGFSRTIEDTGYYKLNRNPMLPIRWMPPEAIRDCKFSTATDVWAFGVLLYEIITFGDVPYRDIPNDWLGRTIASGYEIELPTEVKPALKKMMKACWAPLPEDRATAQELMDFFIQHPKVVIPCVAEEYRAVVDNVDYMPQSSVEYREMIIPTSMNTNGYIPILKRQSSHDSTTSSTALLIDPRTNQITPTPGYVPLALNQRVIRTATNCIGPLLSRKQGDNPESQKHVINSAGYIAVPQKGISIPPMMNRKTIQYTPVPKETLHGSEPPLNYAKILDPTNAYVGKMNEKNILGYYFDKEKKAEAALAEERQMSQDVETKVT